MRTIVKWMLYIDWAQTRKHARAITGLYINHKTRLVSSPADIPLDRSFPVRQTNPQTGRFQSVRKIKTGHFQSGRHSPRPVVSSPADKPPDRSFSVRPKNPDRSFPVQQTFP